MTTATSRVKVKTPKSGSERLELVLLESDNNNNNKASISSLPQSAMMQPTQPAPQPTQHIIEETRNDNNTINYLPNQYNNSTNNTNNNNNNIDDNSSYLTGCSASTAETDNRASAYNNRNNDSSLEMSWSREFTNVNAANVNDRDVRVGGGGREGVGEREGGVQGRDDDDDESDLYGSLEQCESIININDVLSNTVEGGGVGSSSVSPMNSKSVVAKNEQPAAVVKAVNTAAAAVESEEESSQQSQPKPHIQSSPTNLQYKKSVSFDQSLDELLTSATKSEEEEQSSASSSAASDDKKKSKKKDKKKSKKKGSDGSVKSEDTSVESVGYKVKTAFGKKSKSTFMTGCLVEVAWGDL